MKTYEFFVYSKDGKPIGCCGRSDTETEIKDQIPKYSEYIGRYIGKANVQLKSSNIYCATGIFDYLNAHEDELEKYLLRDEK